MRLLIRIDNGEVAAVDVSMIRRQQSQVILTVGMRELVSSAKVFQDKESYSCLCEQAAKASYIDWTIYGSFTLKS